MKKYYAKSVLKNGKQPTVKEHLSRVSEKAKEYGQAIDCEKMAGLAGLFHDYGKYSQDFLDVLNGTKTHADHAIGGAAYLYYRFFGKNTLSTSLLSFCSQNDVTIIFLDSYGNFDGRLCGPVSGNVLLRKKQYDSLNNGEFVLVFVRDLLFCKIRNSKYILMRHARTVKDEQCAQRLYAASDKMSELAVQLDKCSTVDSMRGIEGVAAGIYFSCFDDMLNSPASFRAIPHRMRWSAREWIFRQIG